MINGHRFDIQGDIGTPSSQIKGRGEPAGGVDWRRFIRHFLKTNIENAFKYAKKKGKKTAEAEDETELDQ